MTTHPSHLLRIGTGEQGAPTVWDTRHDTHALIVGHAGSGKSVLARDLAAQAAALPRRWHVTVVDAAATLTAPDREQALGTVEEVLSAEAIEATRRATGDRTGSDLRQRLVVLDGYDALVSLDPTPVGVGRPGRLDVAHLNMLRDSIRKSVSTLVSGGRFAGTHLLLVGQQMTSAQTLGGDVDNISCRIALGHLSGGLAAALFHGAQWPATSPTRFTGLVRHHVGTHPFVACAQPSRVA